jgi:hypothetical protein
MLLQQVVLRCNMVFHVSARSCGIHPQRVARAKHIRFGRDRLVRRRRRQQARALARACLLDALLRGLSLGLLLGLPECEDRASCGVRECHKDPRTLSSTLVAIGSMFGGKWGMP